MSDVSLMWLPEDGEPVNLSYISLDPLGEKVITSCKGDLILFCNILDDYARLLDTYLQMTPELGTIAQSRYYYYARRFRERSDRMAMTRPQLPPGAKKPKQPKVPMMMLEKMRWFWR